MSDESPIRGADVRAIRTAIAGLALAIVTAALIISGQEDLDFLLFVVTLIVVAYSFLQTILNL